MYVCVSVSVCVCVCVCVCVFYVAKTKVRVSETQHGVLDVQQRNHLQKNNCNHAGILK